MTPRARGFPASGGARRPARRRKRRRESTRRSFTLARRCSWSRGTCRSCRQALLAALRDAGEDADVGCAGERIVAPRARAAVRVLLAGVHAANRAIARRGRPACDRVLRSTCASPDSRRGSGAIRRPGAALHERQHARASQPRGAYASTADGDDHRHEEAGKDDAHGRAPAELTGAGTA